MYTLPLNKRLSPPPGPCCFRLVTRLGSSLAASLVVVALVDAACRCLLICSILLKPPPPPHHLLPSSSTSPSGNHSARQLKLTLTIISIDYKRLSPALGLSGPSVNLVISSNHQIAITFLDLTHQKRHERTTNRHQRPFGQQKRDRPPIGQLVVRWRSDRFRLEIVGASTNIKICPLITLLILSYGPQLQLKTIDCNRIASASKHSLNDSPIKYLSQLLLLCFMMQHLQNVAHHWACMILLHEQSFDHRIQTRNVTQLLSDL